LLGEMIVRSYYEGQNKPIYTVREIVDCGQKGEAEAMSLAYVGGQEAAIGRSTAR
ncbi:MAG TPA: hypothetical protein GX702_14945, partial [Chloroflexi bacterium]|nr:hypothetical protein [Chloroflexota bacterium]